MNRTISITLLLLSIGVGVAAAQDAGPSVETNLSSFQIIVRKNIFDPTRSGHYPSLHNRAVATVNAFTFSGTAGDVAYFEGEGVPRRGYVSVGDSVNGFKVRKITLHTVTLTEPSGKIWILNRDESMRQEVNGPWIKSDEPAPIAVTATDSTASGSTETPGTPSVSSTSSGPANESDILKRLRLKREQEEK